MAQPRITQEQLVRNFMNRANIGPKHQCWEWTGTIDNKGYGKISAGANKLVYAHRLAWELMIGPIPKGLVIDHLCRNHSCVNPDHMEVVTIKENVLRGVGLSAINARKTACQNGHELAGDNLVIITKASGHQFRRCRACYNEYQREWRRAKVEGRKMKPTYSGSIDMTLGIAAELSAA